MEEVLLSCPDLPLRRLHRGKVREMFAIDDARLLLVASDRLSAFDVVFGQGIPGKGKVLTAMSELWFGKTGHITANHFITGALDGLPLDDHQRELLAGRSMVVHRARRVDVECVVRGYLSGSGWKEYQQSRSTGGIPLPAGLVMNGQLPEPIFTPALKNDTGHDENVSLDIVADRYGRELAERLCDTSLALYRFGAERCAQAGIILADTKFEFGFVGERLTVIDEILTPDSSRFWPADRYSPGKPIDSLDKQPIRDFVQATGWNMEPPAPELPADVVTAAASRYQEALRRVRQTLA